MNQHPIKEGDATSLADGKVPFGAVRKVSLDGRDELLGYVENASEFAVPTSAVESVHSGKVVFKAINLPMICAMPSAMWRQRHYIFHACSTISGRMGRWQKRYGRFPLSRQQILTGYY